MAQSLVWRDLSAEQLQSIRSPHPKKGLTPRDLLTKFLNIREPGSPCSEIELDLYVHTLQFGQELQLSDAKLSCLLSIVKEVHRRSVEGRMPVDRSFALLRDLLLAHSVHRPPRSTGVLTPEEFKAVLNWALDTYYRHYKLYQYAFTDRVVLNTAQQHPLEVIELPPAGWLQPLNDALTHEQHMALLDEEQRKRAEAERAAAEAAATAAEEARLAALREAYEAAVPDEVRDRVREEVDKQLAALKADMGAKFSSQQEALLAKIAQLEGKA